MLNRLSQNWNLIKLVETTMINLLRAFAYMIIFTAVLTSPAQAASKMYWTDYISGKIQRANLDGSEVEDILTVAPYALGGIAIDETHQKMYWTNRQSNTIQRADLEGSQVETIITTQANEPFDIVLDVAGNTLYWSDCGSLKIRQAALDGTEVKDVIAFATGNPKGLALDLQHDKIYWTLKEDILQTGYIAKIQRADLNGDNTEDLITSTIFNRVLIDPISIDLDVANQYLYWSDFDRNIRSINRATLSGYNIQALISFEDNSVPRGVTLDPAQGKIYWTDRGQHKIQRASLDGSQIEDLVTEGIDSPSGLALIAELDDEPPPNEPLPPPAQAACQLYGVHDQGLNNSQLFVASAPDYTNTQALGALYAEYDIEALDIHPLTDALYAASGDDTPQKGYLYQIDKTTGVILSTVDIRATDGSDLTEIDGLSFHPQTGELWAWAQNQGLLRVQPNTGVAELVVAYDGEIEDLTWDASGDTLYGVQNKHNTTDVDSQADVGGVLLWQYTPATGTVTTLCDEFLATVPEIEALEALTADELMFGLHNQKQLLIGSFDPITCQVNDIKTVDTPYDDVEGLAWPLAACTVPQAPAPAPAIFEVKTCDSLDQWGDCVQE
ncbi:MAG: hypothetical protein SVR94_07160 [Pseudomonadota bacterium]|nr:hypothetical protein [Pseudomonadota bacterium]